METRSPGLPVVVSRVWSRKLWWEVGSRRACEAYPTRPWRPNRVGPHVPDWGPTGAIVETSLGSLGGDGETIRVGAGRYMPGE